MIKDGADAEVYLAPARDCAGIRSERPAFAVLAMEQGAGGF